MAKLLLCGANLGSPSADDLFLITDTGGRMGLWESNAEQAAEALDKQASCTQAPHQMQCRSCILKYSLHYIKFCVSIINLHKLL